MTKKVSFLQVQQKKIAIMVTKRFKQFYLTGGTALAFYFNHRHSEDLDFFTQRYRRGGPGEAMDFIRKETGFSFELKSEQNDPKLIPMRVYALRLKRGHDLKIDFVQDYEENLKAVKNGLHSVEDIYYRKVMTAVGQVPKENVIGRSMSSGRQTAKDLFDLYYLSKHHKPLAEFFMEYFTLDKVEQLLAWYKGFNRTELKMDLLQLVAKVDTSQVLWYLDKEILHRLPDKLL